MNELGCGASRAEGSLVLSIVIPAYNEEESFPRLELRLRPILDSMGEEYELLVIDDGSTDRTNRVLQECSGRWPQVRVISLTRNVGQQLAIAAGLEQARGTWVATMDADLQDPPELLPEMILTARTKHVDVVYAQRADRSSDTLFKRSTARLYYRFMRRASGVDLPADVGDFRLMSRRVVDILNQMPERHKVYRLLMPWLNFPSGVVEYRRDERAAGSSGYSIRRMVRLAAWSLTSFSTAPLRVATWLGLGGALTALALAGVAAGAWTNGRTIPGWTSTTIAVLFLGAVQLLCVGLLGEYVGRIYEQVQARPLFVLRDDSNSIVDLSDVADGETLGVSSQAGLRKE